MSRYNSRHIQIMKDEIEDFFGQAFTYVNAARIKRGYFKSILEDMQIDVLIADLSSNGICEMYVKIKEFLQTVVPEKINEYYMELWNKIKDDEEKLRRER